MYFLFSPFTSMGNTVEMAYKFAVVHGCESILIPGKSIVKQCLEELGVLKEYMTEYHKWIEGEFAARFAISLFVFSLSSACFQTRFQIEAAHPCRWYREN